jgi:hypothetical protein
MVSIIRSTFSEPQDALRAGRPEAPLVLDTELTKSYLLQKLDEAAVSRSASAAGS